MVCSIFKGEKVKELSIPSGNIALVRGSKGGKPLYSLEYGPSNTAEEVVKLYPAMQGFCIVLSDVYPEYGYPVPLSVQYFVRQYSYMEDGAGLGIEKAFWEAHKQDFVRSACQSLPKSWKEYPSPAIAVYVQLISLLQSVAERCSWDVHIFSASDAVIKMSDPFDI